MSGLRQTPSNKVLLGLSGNLMSSVVAALLKHQGFQVIALHFHTEDASRAEAERIARKLGLHLVVEEVQALLEERVRDHIVHKLLANAKAEPELMGHQKVLIEGLCKKAEELRCGMIATGHTARVILDPSTGLKRLVRAADLEHDQSHLLFGLRSEELKQFVLPAGDLSASAVERLAIELELDPEKLKTPSAGFCSIPRERMFAIAEAMIPASMKIPGQIQTSDGTVIGNHDGLFRYHRGQAMTHLKGKGEGLVVTGFERSPYNLIIGSEDLLMQKSFDLGHVNWIQRMDPIKSLSCDARLGHGVTAKACVTPFQHGHMHVELEAPQKCITPGQAVVFYSGDEVLGGGFVL